MVKIECRERGRNVEWRYGRRFIVEVFVELKKYDEGES